MQSLDQFKGTLPYASELFGIYQPLLGWRSRLTKERYQDFRLSLYVALAGRVMDGVRSPVAVRTVPMVATHMPPQDGQLVVEALDPVDLTGKGGTYVASFVDSAVARLIRRSLGEKPPADWRSLINTRSATARLHELQDIVNAPDRAAGCADLQQYVQSFVATRPRGESAQAMMQAFFERETKVAGLLVFLAQHNPSLLNRAFFRPQWESLAGLAEMEDPLKSFGSGAYDAILSPIGIVHLYREYFFELASFLGPAVGHVWLSPGGTVELVEVGTRKVFTERSVEEATESVERVETAVTTQDELADAVKEENRSDTKFGFSNTASYSTPVFQDTATASFSLDNAKATTRETSRKQMREQSEKLSSEIKRSFKTTFRTSTEVTDTSSRRYVLQNTTDKLVNYELRRKMRRVGVQVQDVGVQLCWQTFVDDPGRELGIAKLVHVAEPPELATLTPPGLLEVPVAKSQEVTINIPFVGIDTDDTDNAYTDGAETEVGPIDEEEHIVADHPQSVTFASPGYTLVQVALDPQGSDAKLSVRGLKSAEGSSTAEFTVHLDYVHWHDQPTINVKATLLWEPGKTVVGGIQAENEKRLDAYEAEKVRAYKEAFYAAARERIKLASAIRPRPAEDLREEERTVVYRRLIAQLLKVGTHQSRHVTSELIRSIFDVDKMLYFVAPEWWQPRLHRSAQHLGEESAQAAAQPSGTAAGRTTPSVVLPGVVLGAAMTAQPTPIPSANIVDWGGAREFGRDNYYVTEESQPARLGSSLGWLLQLDGDDLRNAMLNSPWVKAVIPIRIGKEEEAINWLQQAHVEGDDGLDAEYVAAPGDPSELRSAPGHTVTVRDALGKLVEKIRAYDRASRTPVVGNPAQPDSPGNHFAGSLPTEAVFEHGFYPLQGGVKFDQSGTEQAIFSQWTEILPTDQVAAVQVEYDPLTLQVKSPPA